MAQKRRLRQRIEPQRLRQERIRKELETSQPELTEQQLQARLEQERLREEQRLEEQRTQTINRVQEEITRLKETIRRDEERLRERIREERRRGRDFDPTRDDARLDRLRGELRGYEDALRQLNRGQIIEFADIRRFASDIGRGEQQATLQSRQRQQANLQVASQLAKGKGEITRIDYTGGVKASATLADGTKISLSGLSEDQLKNVILSSERRAEQTKLLETAISKDALSAQDFQKARELGISPNDLMQINETGLKAREQTQRTISAFDNALQQANKGNAPNVTQLRNEGVPNEDIKSLQNYFNDIQKFKRDINAITGIYGEKPLPFSSDIKQFEKRQNELVERLDKLELQQKITRLQDVEKVIKQRVQETNQLKGIVSDQVRQKLITGKPLSGPEQLKTIPVLISIGTAKTLGNLAKDLNLGTLSANLIKNTQFYTRSLTARIAKGETNPIANDLKNINLKKVSIGAIKETADILKFIYNTVGSGERALVNYARQVTKAYQNEVGTQKLKTDLRNVVNNTNAIVRGTIELQKFAREHPLESAFIVGAAINAGVIKSQAEFAKNPNENIGRAIVWLFPATIIRGTVSALRLSARSSRLLGTQVAKDVRETTTIISKVLKDLKNNISKPKLNMLEKRLTPIIQNINARLENINNAVSRVAARRQATILLNNKPKVEKVLVEVLTPKEAARVQEKFFGRKTISSKALTISKRNLNKNLNIINTPRGRFTQSQANKLRTDLNKLIGVDIIRVIKDPKNQLFKLQSSESIKILLRKGLKPTNEDIIQALLLARKEGGQSFAQLKKLIKKRLGLNVEQRITKEGITFTLVNPKTKKKTILKSKKTKDKVTKINIEEKSLTDVNPTLNKKLSKKLKNDEFYKSQSAIETAEKEKLRLAKQLEETFGAGIIEDLEKGRVKATKGFFADKKARATFFKQSRNYYNKKSKTTKNIKQEVSKRKGSYKKQIKTKNDFIKKSNEEISNLIKKESKKSLKDRNRTQLNKNLERIKNKQRNKANEIRQTNKITRTELSKLRTTINNEIREILSSVRLLRAAKRLGLLTATQLKNFTNTSNKTSQLLRTQLKEIKDFKFETPIPSKSPTLPKTPKKPKTTKTPSKRTPKTPKVTKTPKTPKTPKSPPKRIPKVVKLPRREPPKRKLIVKLPDLKNKRRKIIEQPLGRIKFVIVDATSNQRRVIQINTGLPYFEAKNLAAEFVDRTLLASFSVVGYGKKRKRLSVVDKRLNKFTQKRSKDPFVQDLVEKPRFRLDKPNEVKQISQARVRALIEEEAKKLRKHLRSLETKQERAKPKKKTKPKRVSKVSKPKKRKKSSKTKPKKKTTKKKTKKTPKIKKSKTIKRKKKTNKKKK